MAVMLLHLQGAAEHRFIWFAFIYFILFECTFFLITSLFFAMIVSMPLMLTRIKANLHCLCPSSFVSCVQVLAMAAVKKKERKRQMIIRDILLLIIFHYQ